MYEVKVDLEQQSLINCCPFKIHEKSNKLVCKCKKCGANLHYKLDKETWSRTLNDVHDPNIPHLKGRYDKDVVLTRISSFMNSSHIDKSFQATLAHLRTTYNSDVLPTETARKLFTEYFQPDWITNWKQLPAYIEALNNEGIPSEITYLSEKNIDKIYIELPYAENLCKSRVFTNIIMLDGTFLKPTTTNGILLIMMTITADKISIPLAAAIVDAESIESYRYFFNKTKHLFNDTDSISVISDQHEAIKAALGETNFVYSPCAFHIIQRYTAARDDFFRMIKSDSIPVYLFYLSEFKQKHSAVYSHVKPYLNRIVRVLGAPYRFGYVSDSPMESINGALGNSRKHEVIYTIDAFLEFCFSQFEKQIKKLEKYPTEPLTNLISNEKNIFETAKGFTVRKGNVSGTYIVMDPYNNNISTNYSVTIDSYSHSFDCSCKMPMETHSPCIHVIQAMKMDNILASKDYYAIFYYRDENINVFNRSFIKNLPVITNIVPDENIIIRPFIKKRPGRPKKIRRYKPTHEKLYSKRHVCRVCKREGHYESAHRLHPDRYPINAEPVPVPFEPHCILQEDTDETISNNQRSRRNVQQDTASIAYTRERRQIHHIIRI